MNDIGKNLRELRKSKGLSIRGLSEKIGISHNTLATYERNEVIPTINYAIKICEFLQVPIEYLVYGKKVTSNFNDNELLQLFNEIDNFNEKEKEIAKNFLKKLIKNTIERKELEKEGEQKE